MAKPSQIEDKALRTLVETAQSQMRQNQATEAVHTLVDALYRLIEIRPELATDKLEPRPGWKIPFLTRWPHLGANWKEGSLAAGQPEIEYVRDKFALSEAITYYEFTLETAIKREV